MTQQVLVIEDNPADMELMVYLLESLGYEALPAADGAEGIAVARSEQPALILCGIHLPQRSGYSLIQALKADAGLCAIPVIAVSAPATAGECEQLLAAGFDDCLSKPLDPEDFVQRMEEFLVPGRHPGSFIREMGRDGDRAER